MATEVLDTFSLGWQRAFYKLDHHYCFLERIFRISQPRQQYSWLMDPFWANLSWNSFFSTWIFFLFPALGIQNQIRLLLLLQNRVGHLKDQYKCFQDVTSDHIFARRKPDSTYLSSIIYEHIIHPWAKCSTNQTELAYQLHLSKFVLIYLPLRLSWHQKMNLVDIFPHLNKVPIYYKGCLRNSQLFPRFIHSLHPLNNYFILIIFYVPIDFLDSISFRILQIKFIFLCLLPMFIILS